MKTILIPTSFSDISRHATDYVIRLMHGEKLKIVLLNSFEQPKTGRTVHLSILDIMKKKVKILGPHFFETWIALYIQELMLVI